jgi:mannitol-1-phosphate 5-dehydrogenase
MPATFVGFGFGPIQTGLMLREAQASGNFSRYVIAEVDQALVDAVRGAGNAVTVNFAGRAGITAETLRGVELLNPGVPADRAAIVSAVRESAEMATAIPSVSYYAAGGEGAIASVLAAAVGPDRHRIVYTAENNNYAAETLREEIEKRAPRGRETLSTLQVLNTVIGKMSGVISSPGEMERLGLSPLVPGFGKCVLVEEFNRILVTRVTLPGFRRGITVFEEKDDLLPFEEAKLFGHNAIHALLGSMARLRGYDVMSRIRDDEELLALGRRAFLQESGTPLVARHRGTGDPLFTPEGFRGYAEDLLERITNPWLHDKVDRIIRDPQRKLGWDDRFFGTIRLALGAGIRPECVALGAAATTLYAMETAPGAAGSPRAFLSKLWGEAANGDERERCLSLVEAAVPRLSGWRR